MDILDLEVVDEAAVVDPLIALDAKKHVLLVRGLRDGHTCRQTRADGLGRPLLPRKRGRRIGEEIAGAKFASGTPIHHTTTVDDGGAPNRVVVGEDDFAEKLHGDALYWSVVPVRHHLSDAVVRAIVAEDLVADLDVDDERAARARDDPAVGSDATRAPVVVELGLVVLDRELHRSANGHWSPPPQLCRRRRRSRSL